MNGQNTISVVAGGRWGCHGCPDYLWGIRSHLKEEMGKRRPRLSKEPVLGDTQASPPDGEVDGHDFGELGRITSDHHLADKALVDVEIRPINRQGSAAAVEADAPTSNKVAKRVRPSHQRPREPQREPTVSPPPKMTLVLTVMAPRHQLFHGPRIRVVVEALQFACEYRRAV